MSKKVQWLLVGTILSWGLGFLGADRIYKNQIALGILKMFTFGGLGVWWLVDALVWSNQLGAEINK